jgi:hypothetical protein
MTRNSLRSPNRWACCVNYTVKRIMWQACNTKAESLLQKRDRKKMTFIEAMSVEIQLFRHIFLSTYNLPNDFNFALYYSMSLDALTADLVELLPSSYIFLILLIFVVEYLVRHYPHNVENFEHPGGRESISEFKSVFLYGLIGFLIFAVYGYLLFFTRRATFMVIKQKFARQFPPVRVKLN